MKKYLLYSFVCFLSGGSYAQQAKTAAVYDTIYSSVDVEASFSGGGSIWRKYLERNCNAQIPADNYAPPGTYTVIVQFVVDKNGYISNVKPLTNHGFGMEEEAIRVISKGPRWQPAMKEGKPVMAYRKQPIIFQTIGDFTLSTYTIVAGKANSVEIALERDDTKIEDIEITLSSGTIRHDAGNKYIIIADKPGRILLTVNKRAKKKKDEEHFGTVAIEVK